jgi:uncharacterized metal-binding protein YceD (DUF177 family)
LLNKPLNILKYCQQKRSGELIVHPADLFDIPECQSDFEVQYQFYLHNSYYAVELTFETVLSLKCQSCWCDYQHTMETANHLIITTDSSEQTHNELSALGFEVVVIEDSQNFTIGMLVKEEIHLQIPFIPRCPKHLNGGEQLVFSDEIQQSSSNSISSTSVHTPFKDLLKNQKN